MKALIKGLRLSTIATIDEILMSSWREGQIHDSEFELLHDVELNDAWLDIHDGIVRLKDGDNEIVLFEDSFVEISIT